MPLIHYRPTTPARRHTSVLRGEVSKKQPEKSLLMPLKKHAGRNNQGKITVRHQGGGNKQFIRMVDFMRDKYNVPARVVAIEYDPNRNAHLALLQYNDGEKRYIVAPQGLKAGDAVMSGRDRAVEIKAGNALPLKHIPTGQFIYNIELLPGKGGRIVRAAGGSAQLMSLEGGYAIVKLPSSEIRQIPEDAMATIGQVSNPEAWMVRDGLAGRTRHRGVRPSVRGKVMNPVDHPHGGGEGKNAIGLKHPKTPWGKPALGPKTRRRKKWSNVFIMQRRKK